MHKQKKIVSLLLILVIIISISLSVSAESVTLMTSMPKQQQTYWCWAACSLQSGYFWRSHNTPTPPGGHPSQSEIVTHIKGAPVNQGANPDAVAHACEYATYDHQSAHAGYAWGLACTFSEIKGFINQSKPIIAGQYNGSSGHMLIVTGYNDTPTADYVKFCDPWDGAGYSMLYSTFISGWNSGYYWDDTVYWWNWS